MTSRVDPQDANDDVESRGRAASSDGVAGEDRIATGTPKPLPHRHSNPSPSHAVVAWCNGTAAEPGCYKPVPLYEFADGPHESYLQDARGPNMPQVVWRDGGYVKMPARSAVVRPTRAEIAQCLRDEMSWLFRDEYEPAISEIIETLVERGWLAVSDSQETPKEGRDE